jgi:hypothetical protein
MTANYTALARRGVRAAPFHTVNVHPNSDELQLDQEQISEQQRLRPPEAALRRVRVKGGVVGSSLHAQARELVQRRACVLKRLGADLRERLDLLSRSGLTRQALSRARGFGRVMPPPPTHHNRGSHQAGVASARYRGRRGSVVVQAHELLGAASLD